MLAQELDGPGGRIDAVVALEGPRGRSQPRDRKPVPAGQDLLVPRGPGAGIADGEQLASCRIQLFAGLGLGQACVRGDRGHRLEHVQVPVPLEVRLAVEPEPARKNAVFVRVEEAPRFIGCPDVEAPFVALGVRVQGRVEPAARVLHVAEDPVRRLGRDAPEERVAGRDRGLGAHGEQLPVVVEHLLEVRDHPVRVHRVPAVAAAELVVEPAFGHAGERERGHVQSLQVGLVAVGGLAPCAQQEFDVGRMWKLRRAAEAAEPAVEVALQRRARRGERGAGEFGAGRGGRRQQLAEHLHQCGPLSLDFGAVLRVVLRHALQHVAERGHAVFRLPGEIGAPEERPVIARREEHRERPAAAALREHLVRGLVDAVEVGPFLSIHLHVDEALVHHGGRRGVFERLVRHHVAPVAGGIADREQDRPVFGPRPLERFRPPRVPVHGIVRVLQEVGARLGSEPVALTRRVRRVHVRVLG